MSSPSRGRSDGADEENTVRPSSGDPAETGGDDEPSRGCVDEFDAFMAAGDDSVGAAEVTPAVERHGSPHPAGVTTADASDGPAPAPAAGQRHPVATGFQAFFQNVSRTLDRSLENAKREIGRNDVLANAQGILQLAGTLPGMAQLSSPPPGDRSGEQIVSLRPLSLNLHGQRLLFAFVGPSRRLVLVTDGKMHFTSTMDSGGDLRLEASFRLRSGVEADEHLGDDPSRVAVPVAPSPSLPKPRKATCGLFLPAAEEVAVGFDDAAVSFYSTAANREGALARVARLSEIGASHATSMRAVPANPTGLAIGCACGQVVFLGAHDLEIARRIPPPDVPVPPPGLPHAPVSCLDVVASEGDGGDGDEAAQVRAVVGYGDGAVTAAGWAAAPVSFFGHCDAVVGCVALVGGLLAVSVGSDMDPAICVTETAHGRCLARRALAYTATVISRVEGSLPPSSELYSPSHTAFLVGGAEGQVDIFRAVVLSATCVEICLVSRVAERSNRGNRVAAVALDLPGDIAVAISTRGHVRRWRLGEVESHAITNRIAVTPQLVSELLDGGESSTHNVAVSRLSASDRVVGAQRILASLLQDEDVGLADEETKDELVNQFSQAQSRMCELATLADRELARARRRVFSRFSTSTGGANVPHDSRPGEARLGCAARQMAAFELQSCGVRHSEQVEQHLAQAIDCLQSSLRASLERASGDDARLAEVRAAILAL
jgi:hypothetical protein